MQVLKGNKVEKLNIINLIEALGTHKKTILDIGAGDGRFAFKNAQMNDENFYIAMEPNKKQLEIYSKKAQKEKLTNLIFIIESVELLDESLNGLFDEVYINLPWGSLLSYIVNPNKDMILKLLNLLKVTNSKYEGGKLFITLGYNPLAEPKETERLNLPDINESLINKKIIPAFTEVGFALEKTTLLSREKLNDFQTNWAKRLSFGKERPIYQMVFKK